VKFYGPSKDTPFFAGYRIGYWFGDPRLQEPCREHAWVAENSANPLSMTLFGVNLLLRAGEALGEPLAEDHMRFLQDGMFGWGQRIDRAQALERDGQPELAAAAATPARHTQQPLVGARGELRAWREEARRGVAREGLVAPGRAVARAVEHQRVAGAAVCVRLPAREARQERGGIKRALHDRSGADRVARTSAIS
jgi:hypothetical protein